MGFWAPVAPMPPPLLPPPEAPLLLEVQVGPWPPATEDDGATPLPLLPVVPAGLTGQVGATAAAAEAAEGRGWVHVVKATTPPGACRSQAGWGGIKQVHWKQRALCLIGL